MNAFEVLARQELGAAALEASRISGLVVVSPVLWGSAPKTVKAALVVVFTVLAHGHSGVSPAVLGSPELAALGMLGEFGLGAAMGMVVRLVIAAAEIAANAVAPLIGFGVSQIFDPTSGGGSGQETVLTVIFRSLALWIALIVGAHHAIIGALLGSFQVAPAGSFVSASATLPVLLEACTAALSTGVRIALPILAVLFMVQIALGFLSRAAPAMQIFSVGFAFTLVTGGLVLALSLPDIGRELAIELANVGGRIEGALAAAATR